MSWRLQLWLHSIIDAHMHAKVTPAKPAISCGTTANKQKNVRRGSQNNSGGGRNQVSDAEKKRRQIMKEKCFHCARADHFANNCQSIKEQVVEEFPEVFRDELSKELMRVPEMRIAFRDNGVPFCITSRCEVPLQYQEAVDKDDLICSKVIAKETRPAEWGLPAFFVPKPDGVRVR